MTTGIAVIGCGIIGLSTSILLLESGEEVTIYAADKHPQISSSIACAIWLPILVTDENRLSSEAISKYAYYAKASWEVYERQSNEPRYGINWSRLHRLMRSEQVVPHYSSIVKNFRREKPLIINGEYDFEWSFDTFVIESPVYMQALYNDFIARGGKLIRRRFESIGDILSLPESIIFNCTGMGAKKLFSDEDLEPIKGQLIFHEPVNISHSISDGVFCVIPRSDALVLGTTYESSFSDLEATETGLHLIWENALNWLHHCHADTPFSQIQISKELIKTAQAGIRPYRTTGIRIEAEIYNDKIIVHNYGHGGSGYTYSWGTAKQAIGLMSI